MCRKVGDEERQPRDDRSARGTWQRIGGGNHVLVMLNHVRWYIAHPLTLRHLEEMMAKHGISVDRSPVRR
ncbi:hypothetical protein PQH74_22155 [Cupriavidus metallidurans]|jgi:hypothetical protein|nr:hypothetical protein [Cupriavidus metallidurans]KWW39394.1 hypothetical protein AU374_00460 [Cupriavidus metallidurans]MDE4920610.1 hypothetical protein [Cupriavidus metallidurans]